MSYVSNRYLTNVAGRIDYISNSKRQENIIDFYNSQDIDFWKQLAKENREQFKASSNSKRANRKAIEAREFIIALPQTIDTEGLAEYLCNDFKNQYGVECACAIHYKSKTNNLHAHLIFSERELLPAPIIVEQKVAPRTYYYDEHGKKCKKAEAVKIVPKGTITQKGCTRYFENKKDFFSMTFVRQYKAHIEKEFQLPAFDNSRHFAHKHIGKNNPKEDNYADYHSLVDEMNEYFDSIEGKYEFGNKIRKPKEEFCRIYDIPCKSTFSVFLTADIREKFAEFEKLYPLNEKTAQNRFESVTDTIVDKNTNNQTVQEPKDEVETLESLSDDELISDYTYMTKWLSSAKSDLSDVFIKYDCPYTRLERNSYWEQNKNFPVKWYDVDYSINRVNRVIENNNLEIEKIPENKATATRAYNQATNVFELLQQLIEELKKFIEELFAEIKNRGLENKEINRNEIEQDEEYDKEY